MHSILARTITFIVLIIAAIATASAVYGALDENSHVYYLSSIVSRCHPIEQKEKANKVIIRMDDIQSFGFRDTQMRMISDALEQDIPLSLSVIPFRLREDNIIYHFLKKNRCNLEFAVHGWDSDFAHQGEIPEFGTLSEDEAYERIAQGKPVIEKLAGRLPTTFVPPNNEYSRGTVHALARSGFSIITSEGAGPFYNYDASTFDFLNFVDNSNEFVLSRCKEALDTRNLCIIMIHPQDFATNDGQIDKTRYADYLALLSSLKGMNVQFETFESFARNDINLQHHWEQALADGIQTTSTDLAQCTNYLTEDIVIDPSTYQHNVRVLQIFLKYFAGFPGLEINGKYDHATARSVITLRERTGDTLSLYGLPADITQVPTKDLINTLYCISGSDQALARAISIQTPYESASLE